MKRNIYVASSWRNKYQPDFVRDLQQRGHQVYDFREADSAFGWNEIDPNWQAWTTKEYIKCIEHPLARIGFQRDMGALKRADTVVLLLPSGPSAHIEAGYAVGAGKEVLVLIPPGEKVEPDLMYRMCNGIFSTFEDIILYLEKGSTKTGSQAAPPPPKK